MRKLRQMSILAIVVMALAIMGCGGGGSSQSSGTLALIGSTPLDAGGTGTAELSTNRPIIKESSGRYYFILNRQARYRCPQQLISRGGI